MLTRALGCFLALSLCLGVSLDGAKARRTTKPRASKCASCPRDSHGRITRSQSATTQFKQRTGYPKGRPGYVIDHIIPLACGGADTPYNMQWSSKAEAKAKDRWERQGCQGMR